MGERPFEVSRAINAEDVRTLSAMGRKGARVSAEVRRIKADIKALIDASRLADAQAHEEELLNGVPEHDR